MSIKSDKMDSKIKEQLIEAVDNIKNKMKIIKNEEDAANLKFKKVFKPITENLETLIKTNDKCLPAINLSLDLPKNNTMDDLDESLNYRNFMNSMKSDSDQSSIYNTNISQHNTKEEPDAPLDCYRDFMKSIKSDSDKDSEYYDVSDDTKINKKNNTLMSLNKEDVIDIYSDDINVPFGIRKENMNLMMGNSKVSFSYTCDPKNNVKNYMVSINEKHYKLTPGLKELLMRSKPNLNTVTEYDKIVYKDILHYTNAHKRDFNPKGQIKGDKGVKYRQIIKPMFSERSDIRKTQCVKQQTKSGGYIPKNKKYRSNTDYVYWDDPNELVERLKILIASQNAGNTGHDNEILSIIEELKEAGIIQ